MGRDLEIGTVHGRGEQGDRGQTRPDLCPWDSFGLTAAKGRHLIQNGRGNKAKGCLLGGHRTVTEQERGAKNRSARMDEQKWERNTAMVPHHYLRQVSLLQGYLIPSVDVGNEGWGGPHMQRGRGQNQVQRNS